MDLNKNFVELSMDDVVSTEGGIVICGVTIAGLTLLKIAGATAALGITTGVTIGLNRVNRTN